MGDEQVKETGLEELFSQEPKAEVETEEKPEEKVEASPEETPEEPSETEKKEEKPEEPSGEEKPEEEKPPVAMDWESDDNPYRKRYQDTQKWANDVNQKNLQLEKDIAKGIRNIGRKLDGEEPEGDEETPNNDQHLLADYQGRLSASHQLAVQQFGEAKVQEMITGPEAPYGKYKDDPVVQVRVLNSPAPVFEAMRIVEERQFMDKYGDTYDKIRENFRKELEPEIREQVSKEFQEKLKRKEKQPSTLANARSAAVAPEEKGGFREKSTDEIFAQ